VVQEAAEHDWPIHLRCRQEAGRLLPSCGRRHLEAIAGAFTEPHLIFTGRKSGAGPLHMHATHGPFHCNFHCLGDRHSSSRQQDLTGLL